MIGFAFGPPTSYHANFVTIRANIANVAIAWSRQLWRPRRLRHILPIVMR